MLFYIILVLVVLSLIVFLIIKNIDFPYANNFKSLLDSSFFTKTNEKINFKFKSNSSFIFLNLVDFKFIFPLLIISVIIINYLFVDYNLVSFLILIILLKFAASFFVFNQFDKVICAVSDNYIYVLSKLGLSSAGGTISIYEKFTNISSYSIKNNSIILLINNKKYIIYELSIEDKNKIIEILSSFNIIEKK